MCRCTFFQLAIKENNFIQTESYVSIRENIPQFLALAEHWSRSCVRVTRLLWDLQVVLDCSSTTNIKQKIRFVSCRLDDDDDNDDDDDDDDYDDDDDGISIIALGNLIVGNVSTL